MRVFLLSLVGGLLLWPMVVSAGLYKWTDDQGNLHITDTPPPMMHKKSTPTAVPVPRSSSPKKATVRPTVPGPLQAEVQPVPDPVTPSLASEEVPIQRAMEGLSPSQATLTSSWHIFESTPANAKAPVQRWKDQQGLDHVVDVLPATLGNSEAAPKREAVSTLRSRLRVKERATGISRSHLQPAE